MSLVPYVGVRIINRIGILDYIVKIVSDDGNIIELKRYINIKYVLKFINNAVLGTPFPEAEIMTSRVMSVVYRGASEEDLRKTFMSEPWTAWGMGYVFLVRGGAWQQFFF